MHDHAQWHALAEAQLAAGTTLFQRGDHAAAVAAYSLAIEALAAEPAASQRVLAAQLLRQRAHSHFIRRDLPASIADYDQALALDPGHPEAHSARGLARYQSGRSMQAVADYDQAIALYLARPALDAAETQALAATLLNRANAHYQRRDYAAAIADYDQALLLDPAQLEALLFRGVARQQQGQHSAALADYQTLLANPLASPIQRAQALYNQGLLRRQRGDLAGAIADYSAALALNPKDADCLLNRGSARADGGDLAGAIEDYSAALALNPWLDDGFNTRGMARLLNGDAASAIEDFSRAIAHTPQAANVHANRGSARLQLGDFLGAIEDFSAELALRAPGLKGRVETREKRAEVYNNRGLARHYAGELEAARADYSRAIEQLRLSGSEAEIGPRLASILLNRGLVQRALAEQPEAARPQELLRQAQADLEQALGLSHDPQLALTIRQHLAEMG